MQYLDWMSKGLLQLPYSRQKEEVINNLLLHLHSWGNIMQITKTTMKMGRGEGAGPRIIWEAGPIYPSPPGGGGGGGGGGGAGPQ